MKRTHSRYWWLLLLLPLGFGFARLRFDVDILNLLPPQLGIVQGLKLHQAYFANARELLVTVEAPTVTDTEAAAASLAQALRAQTSLVASVTWQPAGMGDPAQAGELIALLWLNQPPAAFAEMAGRLAPATLATTLAATRDRLATTLSPGDLAAGPYDPYGLTQLPGSAAGQAPGAGASGDAFASEDGTFRVLYVEARDELAGYQDCRQWLDGIQRCLEEVRREPGFPRTAIVGYTGRPAFVVEVSRSMEQDLSGASVGTLGVIAALFWLAHRRWAPLFALLAFLVATLAGSLALGGLAFGTLNVISLGFASILLGLAEDYGIVIYQEARSHPQWSVCELRRAAAPGIGWSAGTTAGAFLLLNFSSLPGLGQLGSLVALGIVLAAVVMLGLYVPLVVRLRRAGDDKRVESLLLFQTRRVLPPPAAWLVTGVALAAAAGLLWRDGLRVDHSSDPLQPRTSQAFAALERVNAALSRGANPLLVLIPGPTVDGVADRLRQVEAALEQAVSNRLIAGFTLPIALWPTPDNQRANLAALPALLATRDKLHEAAQAAGFAPEAMTLTDVILGRWDAARDSTAVLWPTNAEIARLVGRFAAQTSAGFVALGMVQPPPDAASTRRFLDQWPEALAGQGIVVTGWELLGATVFDLVLEELPLVLGMVSLLVLVSLWLAFRDVREVLLSLAVLAFSALCLAGTMNLLGWRWNLLNVMGLPLLLGMGVDFALHIQLALRRYDGDRLAVRRSVGRALLLAGSTTVAGFGSLAFSSNAGMASLGRVCALGIALTLLVAVYLLPVWWDAIRRCSPASRPTLA